MPELISNPYSLSKDEILKTLNSSENGLSEEEVNNRLKTYGQNVLTPKKKISAWQMYLEQFKNTLTLILIGSAFLILFIYFFGEKDPADLIEAGLILTIILMITFLGFIQEYKAEKSIEALKKLLAFKAKVKRDGVEKEIDVSQLVPGDIVILEEGEKVPADIRLLEVFSLSVNEASLTGESSPVSKNILQINGKTQINDQKNMVFSSTAISSGRAIGIVIKTGDQTEIGQIAKDVSETAEEQTPIQKKLNDIGKTLAYIIIGICAIVFIFIVFFAQDFSKLPLLSRIIHSFISSVALAVAAIPEGLPAVVTISLALGTRRMLRKNALIRKLNSVETLGSTDVICSDKTGTLTKGEMTVRQVFFNSKVYEVSGTGFEPVGKFSLDGKLIAPDELESLLKVGLNCNNSNIAGDKILGDPTEAALKISALKAGLTTPTKRVQEIPFSSERKMMSVISQEADGNFMVYTKGATEVILENCQKIVKENGKELALNETDKKVVLDQNLKMSTKALRTLAFAYRKLTPQEYNQAIKDPSADPSKIFEQNLIFVGLQGMIDPPRVEVKPLIDKCQASGIRVIMITGDHVETAKAVGAEIGIVGEALTGTQLEEMSEEEFNKIVEKVSIYARINPSSKMRIVDALKKNGHIVAMTGDGVNDAPALKKADIGIAMGITGTDVAKEASDMVLLDDHFSTIVYAIEEGRGIFHNIRKFVNYLLSCNIGEVLVVFVSVMLFQKLPLTATMLLWINVVTDGIPAIALGLDPAEKGILNYSPKAFQSQIISKRLWLEMFIFGILLTIGVLGIYFMDLPKGVEAAQGAAFTAIVMYELVNLFIIRSAYKTSLFSNKWLIIAVITTILIQITIIYTPVISTLFEVDKIDLRDWIYIISTSIALWIIFKLIQKFLDFAHIFTPKLTEPK